MSGQENECILAFGDTIEHVPSSDEMCSLCLSRDPEQSGVYSCSSSLIPSELAQSMCWGRGIATHTETVHSLGLHPVNLCCVAANWEKLTFVLPSSCEGWSGVVVRPPPPLFSCVLTQGCDGLQCNRCLSDASPSLE